MVPPEIIDLSTLAESFDQETTTSKHKDEFTFDQFFHSSPGLTTISTSSHSVQSTPPPRGTSEPWHRWVGWSWDPPAYFFEGEPPSFPPPPQVSSKPSPFDPKAPYTTPIRPTQGINLSSQRNNSVPRTAPRSINRTRPVSERQAFKELIRCVQMSARKKVGGIGEGGSASLHRFLDDGRSSRLLSGRREIPLTPTPAARSRESMTSGSIGLNSAMKIRSDNGPALGEASTEPQSYTLKDEVLEEEDSRRHEMKPARTLEQMEAWHSRIEGNLDVGCFALCGALPFR